VVEPVPELVPDPEVPLLEPSEDPVLLVFFLCFEWVVESVLPVLEPEPEPLPPVAPMSPELPLVELPPMLPEPVEPVEPEPLPMEPLPEDPVEPVPLPLVEPVLPLVEPVPDEPEPELPVEPLPDCARAGPAAKSAAPTSEVPTTNRFRSAFFIFSPDE
jgi:hypothetical protein